jgi:hypothetical protein
MLAVYVASDESAFVHGTVSDVDGRRANDDHATYAVITGDLIAVAKRPLAPQSLRPGRRVQSGSGGSALASWLREVMPSVVNTFRRW